MEQKTLWVFKSFEEERSFGGNEGYADEPELAYVYDNTVINHNRVREGDLAIIVNKKHVAGIATIERITVQHNIPKKQYACPVCGTKRLAARKKALPEFRCKNKHEFSTPIVSTISVSQSKAIYSADYIRISERVPAGVLAKYYNSYNAYYSIQSADMTVLDHHFPMFRLLTETPIPDSVIIPYAPSLTDSRDYRLLKSAIRPEQGKFRQLLIERHGMKCMISGCAIPEAIDASHICPYRGIDDNHLSNGLLLRKDLHALFDADLLGIEPSTLAIHISPILKNTSYEDFCGHTLKIKNGIGLLSPLALAIKWSIFMDR
ncbi:HNH endonuclease [Mucilaginibacter sp. AK015]|uniref:HNH endonuclease n=1 Tax=Mucilaginibacter sp. AK015 TaxID=2723072 RepID=UPI00160EE2F7|nr:HNH endonuclease [Mucilaginibacter sp. AK015]MBB5396706.1 hypothetical protein [Mucilaginibacter sp. AK015]